MEDCARTSQFVPMLGHLGCMMVSDIFQDKKGNAQLTSRNVHLLPGWGTMGDSTVGEGNERMSGLAALRACHLSTSAEVGLVSALRPFSWWAVG